MYCDRCGAENRESSRYCSSCGANLRPSHPSGVRGAASRVGALVGRSRKEQLVTAAILVAVAIAVISLLSLDTDPDEGAPDAPTLNAADQACIEAKQTVAEAASRANSRRGRGLEGYAIGFLMAAVDFRATLAALQISAGEGGELDTALRNAAIKAGALARVSREASDRAAVTAQIGELDRATGALDDAIDSLGLGRCATVRIIPNPGT